MKLRWRFGILAGLVLLVCGSYPQLKMWHLRGAEWQGAYAYNDIDEVAYASYLRALIDGRVRKNDPYTGLDDAPENPQPESLFSIQFAAPYTVAIPARILGVSASTAMWMSGGIAAFLAGLVLFWLIGKLTGDSRLAMAGALIVVCGGALAGGEGAIGEVLGGGEGSSYPYFPGLRRYVPAIPFPVFFALCGCVWGLVTTRELKKRIAYCVLASFCFSFLVFSYFYIWTTAAAWLICVVLVWFAARPEGWQKDFKAFAALALACLVPLLFYAFMLQNRSQTMDDVQLLVLTREPDLLRIPELISFAVIAMLILAIALKVIELKNRSTLFALSFALVPIIVFNQQIITGRSLQPIHYQVFIGNYVAALALVVTLGILFREVIQKHPAFSRTLITTIAVIAAAWGIVECHYTVRVLDEANIIRDEGMLVAKRLEELSKTDVSSTEGNYRAVVFASNMIQGDDLPTVAPQAVLWARHQHVFAGLTWQESKERYYQYLYYLDLDEKWLANSIKNGDFVSMIALFGWGRHTNRLNSAYKPLTYGEIDEEARRFGEYRKNFSFAQASKPKISYVVVPNDQKPDFTNLDFWYNREAEEIHGKYTLYKVNLKTGSN